MTGSIRFECVILCGLTKVDRLNVFASRPRHLFGMMQKTSVRRCWRCFRNGFFFFDPSSNNTWINKKTKVLNWMEGRKLRVGRKMWPTRRKCKGCLFFFLFFVFFWEFRAGVDTSSSFSYKKLQKRLQLQHVLSNTRDNTRNYL